jgi:serralysin
VLHRTPDAGGLQFWVDSLNTGMSRAEVLIGFSESAENQANVIGSIQNGIFFTL